MIRPVRPIRVKQESTITFEEWLIALDVHKAIKAMVDIGISEARAIATVRRGLGVEAPKEVSPTNGDAK